MSSPLINNEQSDDLHSLSSEITDYEEESINTNQPQSNLVDEQIQIGMKDHSPSLHNNHNNQQQQQQHSIEPNKIHNNNYNYNLTFLKVSDDNDRPATTTISINNHNSSKHIFSSFKNPLKMSNNQVLPIEHENAFQIFWKNISYTVRIRDDESWFQMKNKTILNSLSGCFSSGQVAAIMGPSGAGKSTFLEVLACRKEIGVSGWLKVKNIEKIRIAYVPQNNYLMEKLTVLETLTFALKLNYSTTSIVNYSLIDKVIKQFGLTNIKDTRLGRCSGGQQKRVSIALELFSKPNILILDEPTTGLDSSSCALVVKILRELVKNPKYPMAILCTIHQPSWAVFTEFHNVYIINRNGENLYLGPPQKLLPLLDKVNLPCDKYNSPPDYIIEIAAGDYGSRAVKAIQLEFQGPVFDENTDLDKWLSVVDARIIRKTPLLKSTLILTSRSALIFRRNIMIAFIRILAIVLLSCYLSLTFGHDIGRASGCPMHKLELYNVPLEKLSSLFEEEMLTVMQNNCCLFFGLIVGLISGMATTVLDFPREMHIFMKEYNNGWYSCISFYITKTIMDIPMQVLIPSIFIGYTYMYTGQPKQYYREGYLLFITIMVSFASESMGSAISAIFMNEPTTATFVAGALPMPMILFGGFLVKYSRMPRYMQITSWFSLMKYAFEGFMVAIYGFDRCDYNYREFQERVNISTIGKPTWAEYLPLIVSTLNPEDGGKNDPIISNATAGMDEDEKAIYMLYTTAFNAIQGNGTKALSFDRSIIFQYYGIEDDSILYRSVIVLVIYVSFIKFCTYFVILNKLKRGAT